MQSPGKINLRLVSLLGGLCFFLSAIEFIIPKPLPFIRLGLANFPLLLALDLMPFPSFMLLIAVKITGQALISGTLFSYTLLFSLGGTVASALVMFVLRRGLGREKISLIGVSVAGALASNAMTLLLAYFLVFRDSIRYMAAPVLALGIVTGTLLGIACEHFIKKSEWYLTAAQRTLGETDNIQNSKSPSFSPCLSELELIELRERKTKSTELAMAGLCMIPALLLNPSTPMRALQFFLFFFLALLSGRKINLLLTLVIIATIVFFNLLVQHGELLFSIGPLIITSGALEAGIRRAVTLSGLFMLSKWCIRQDLVIPGFFGQTVGEALRVFSRLSEEKQLFNWRNWAKRLDAILISYSEDTPTKSEIKGQTKDGKNLTSRFTLAAVLILAWLPLILALVYR